MNRKDKTSMEISYGVTFHSFRLKFARCQRLPPMQEAISHTTDFKISQNLAMTAANGATVPESVATQFAGGFTYLYKSGTDEQRFDP
jgi:hypothetical protein